MTRYYENATVVYTTTDGKKIDTFVVFDTDEKTGLTHINHENLRVPADRLSLHTKTACKYHMPLEDAFSFELLNKLKAKYKEIDSAPRTVRIKKEREPAALPMLAKAS